MMKSLWAKITACILAIVALFTGLFFLNKKQHDPAQDPTAATEQVTEPISETESKPQTDPTSSSEDQPDLPIFTAGEANGVYKSSGTTEIKRFENVAEKDFVAYRDELKAKGFTLYDTNEIEGNRFATMVNDSLAVYLSWYTRTGTFRIIAEERTALCPVKDTYETVCDTLLTGMKGETVVAAEGMGYIIRLADGSFCIIDGGMGDPDHVDSDRLMGILNAQKSEGTKKPVIAAWIFSHMHGDHIGVFNCFSLDHHDDVVLERLYFNFPKEEEVAASDSPYMLDDTIYRYTQFKKNLSDFYADVPVVKLHSGNRFRVRNAAFEVLYAYDDLYPQTILDGGMNENSLLLKMELKGQTFLWTGDFAFHAADLVLEEYSAETLGCDFLQLAHHGMNGTVALYSAVNPTYALLPVWHGGIDTMLQKEQNQWLVNSEKMRQLLVTGCGTWTIRLPYTPADGAFERIPTEGSVYPAYPSLLGE